MKIKHCERCGKPIPALGANPADYRVRRFCGRKCSAAAGWSKKEECQRLIDEFGECYSAIAMRTLLLAVLDCRRLSEAGGRRKIENQLIRNEREKCRKAERRREGVGNGLCAAFGAKGGSGYGSDGKRGVMAAKTQTTADEAGRE
jgi:hypothetical protein